MECINDDSLILSPETFNSENIRQKLMQMEFNSLAKFELFIWDLEMFLQFQRKLGNKILLKGGAATQFYIPIKMQRTSVDIDMVCYASRSEVHSMLESIENELGGQDGFCKFRKFKPIKPKVDLNILETYYETVPSICNKQELYTTKGKQEVKIEFIFTDKPYSLEKANKPHLFALDTHECFNLISFEDLFADKLTTLGPNTIGVSDERVDEQFKQIYDLISLFLSNSERVLSHKDLLFFKYEEVAKVECALHKIDYDLDILLKDMKNLINRIINIENDSALLRKANDFQSLYLRKSVNRDKTEWVIVGYQLSLLHSYIFEGNNTLLAFDDINRLITQLQFNSLTGSDRGNSLRKARDELKSAFNSLPYISETLFRKRIDRIIWELITHVELEKIINSLSDI